MISILLSLLLVGIVLALVLRPLLVARAERQSLVEERDDELENLLFEREALLAALRDIRFDREMGKLTEEDFSTLDAQYRARAVEVLKQLDAVDAVDNAEIEAEDALDAWIEAEVRARRTQHKDRSDVPTARHCPGCGKPLAAGDRFCSQCGAPVAAEAGT